ncbi:hypothetical protein KJ951_02350 [Patescibacteria group bacterium]|nr:hypothetical protein [Patescibacteria group bacterium]MBU1703222.1 hypothetical protein [Patescibacteria group bacterium]MBU1953747.1 hypothetical protein [Patescibacteria group bacterium]
MTQKQQIIQLLRRIGLTESEAELYFTAHKYPKLTLSELQKKTNYSTASVYRAFDNLYNLGFLTASHENWKKNIEAVSLKTISEKLACEQRKLRKIELKFKQLDSLINFSLDGDMEDPLEIHTDKNKVADSYFQILSEDASNMRVFGSAERLIDIFGSDLERAFVNIRRKKGIKCDVVLTESGDYAKELMASEGRELRNTKIKVSPSLQDTMCYISGQKATILQKNKNGEDRAVVIKDPALVKMQEKLFDSLWGNSP